MGTKVCFKNYPESVGYSMRDLNEDTSGTWPLYCEDWISSGQLCNGFISRIGSGYSEYDKELFKQTMLKHEEIFRKQVFELHRLYRIQRDLMVDLKRKGQVVSCAQGKTSQSGSIFRIQRDLMVDLKGKGEEISSVQVQSYQPNSLSTQIFSQDMKTLEDHMFSSLNTGYSAATVSCTDNALTHLSLKETSFKSGPVTSENVDSQGAEKCLDSREKKVPRRVIDLRLPAEAYIENDEIRLTDTKLNGRNCLVLENEVDLAIYKSQNTCSENKKLFSHVRNGVDPIRLADLNEPLKGAGCLEMEVSSGHSQPWSSVCEGLEELHKSRTSGSGILGFQKDLCHGRYKVEEAETVSLCGDEYTQGQNRPFDRNEIPQFGDHANSFTSTLSRKDSISSLAHDARRSELNIHGKSMPPSALHCTDYTKTASPLVTSWGRSLDNMSNSSTEIQAISCSSRSTAMNIHSSSSRTSLQNIGNSGEKWQSHHDFGTSQRSGHEKCARPNGLCHGLISESNDSPHISLSAIGYDKPIVNNDANSLYEKSESHRFWANFKSALSNGSTPCGTDGKESQFSCLGTKSPSDEHVSITKGACKRKFGVLEGYSRMFPGYCTPTVEDEHANERKDNHAGFLPDFSSSLKEMEARYQQNESSVSSSRRIPGFPAAQCKNDNFTPSSNQEISIFYDVRKVMVDELLSKPPYISNTLNHDKQIHGDKSLEKSVAKGFVGFKTVLDLNTRATSIDGIDSPAISSKDEVEFPSPVSVRGTATRYVLDIDLEAPATPLSEEQIPSAESASNSDQLDSLVELGSKPGVPQVEDLGAEAIVRLAAETIRKISLDKAVHLEDRTCLSSPPAAGPEVLRWFADAVISNADNLENFSGLCVQESSDIDGMDFFEYMTLKLEDTKVDEYCCGPSERENSEDEEADMSRLLMTKPRRGQARKRRQKRDFQKDILPGLASLSRYEVTEDMQLFGGLMRASGQLWQPCGARRNSGRTKARGQPKETISRQRNNATDVAASVAAAGETWVDPPSLLPTVADAEIDMRNIVGWGRTTRRCRSQRCSPGNVLVGPPSS